MNYTSRSEHNGMAWFQIVNLFIMVAGLFFFHSDWMSMLRTGRIDGLTKALACVSLEYEVGDTSELWTLSSEDENVVRINEKIEVSKLSMERNRNMLGQGGLVIPIFDPNVANIFGIPITPRLMTTMWTEMIVAVLFISQFLASRMTDRTLITYYFNPHFEEASSFNY